MYLNSILLVNTVHFPALVALNILHPQPTAEVHHFFLYSCQTKGQAILFGVLYGYKALVQVTALILAFRTRKVKVKGLDDSKYIAAAIYVTSIVLAVVIISTYTLRDYVNTFPALVGMGLLVGTTMILALVFIPRVSTFHSHLLKNCNISGIFCK